jgi:hypothetical protein
MWRPKVATAHSGDHGLRQRHPLIRFSNPLTDPLPKMEHNVINLTKGRGDQVHELAAVQDVLRVVLQAAKEQNARRVTAIALKVGRTYAVENLRDLIAIAAKGTIAEGARLDVEAAPGSAIQVATIDIE